MKYRVEWEPNDPAVVAAAKERHSARVREIVGASRMNTRRPAPDWMGDPWRE